MSAFGRLTAVTGDTDDTGEVETEVDTAEEIEVEAGAGAALEAGAIPRVRATDTSTEADVAITFPVLLFIKFISL